MPFNHHGNISKLQSHPFFRAATSLGQSKCIRYHTLDIGAVPQQAPLHLHCLPCGRTSHTQISLTSTQNPTANRRTKCLLWPHREPQQPMSHLRYWVWPYYTSIFPPTFTKHSNRKTPSCVCCQSQCAEAWLSSGELGVGPFTFPHLLACMCLFIYWGNWHVRWRLWSWGIGWSDGRGKVRLTQTVMLGQDKQE